MIGLLFISNSSTVTPKSVGDGLLPTLELVALLAPNEKDAAWHTDRPAA